MKVKVEKLPKSTVQLDISVPTEKVKEAYDQALAKIAQEVELKGFRKGKAPKDMVEKSVDPAKINGEVVNILLEKYYVQALKENKIAPISNPKVEIEKFSPDEDFEFTAKVAVRPDVKIGDYKKELKKAAENKHKETAKQKEAALKEGKPLNHVHDHLHTNEIIDVITESAEVDVPEMLVEDEVNRYMARLVDQIGALNMDLNDYLKAQQKTADQIRGEFAEMAEKNLKAEFAMAQAIKDAGIEVTDAEIEETAKASGDPQALENLKDPTTKWYIKSVLEKNKLLETLMEELGISHESHAPSAEKSTDESEDKEKEDK